MTNYTAITPREIFDQRNTLVVQRRKEGLSLGKIAAEFQISRERVRQIIRRADPVLSKQLTKQIAKQRAQSRPRVVRKALIKNLLAQGKSLEEIQQTLDISGIIFQRLLRALHTEGVAIPGRRFYGILTFNEIKAMVDQGKSSKEIAEQYHVSISNVNRILREGK